MKEGREYNRQESELSDLEKIETFFSVFNNLEVENHENPPKKIKIKISHPGHLLNDSAKFSTNEYLMEFEGYEPYSVTRHGQTIGNYAWFHVDYTERRVIPAYVSLVDPALKSNLPSKGVYPTIRRLIGQNFPEGFSYYVEIDNQRTRNQLLDIRKKVNERKISEIEGIALIKNHYKLQQRIIAGFNFNHVQFEHDDWVSIQSKKIPNGEDFEVFFDL